MKELIFILSIPWTLIFRGLVLTKLWAWFVGPLFHLPALGIPYALGISVLASLLTASSAAKAEKQEWWVTLLTGPVVSLFALGFGWVIHLFI